MNLLQREQRNSFGFFIVCFQPLGTGQGGEHMLRGWLSPDGSPSPRSPADDPELDSFFLVDNG
jgi:hypothetical protein